MSTDPTLAPDDAPRRPTPERTDHLADVRRRLDEAADVLADGLFEMLVRRAGRHHAATQPTAGAVENA